MVDIELFDRFSRVVWDRIQLLQPGDKAIPCCDVKLVLVQYLAVLTELKRSRENQEAIAETVRALGELTRGN